MTHALSTIATTPISKVTKSSLIYSKVNKNITTVCCLHDNNVETTLSSDNALVDPPMSLSPISRRDVIRMGVAGAIIGLNVGEKMVWAAARRPPPAPQGEKQDPNISGVQAKVLASKKRKEAMKQAISQLRERGKKIDD